MIRLILPDGVGVGVGTGVGVGDGLGVGVGVGAGDPVGVAVGVGAGVDGGVAVGLGKLAVGLGLKAVGLGVGVPSGGRTWHPPPIHRLTHSPIVTPHRTTKRTHTDQPPPLNASVTKVGIPLLLPIVSTF